MTAALLRDGRVVIREVRFCVRPWSRLRGLLGVRALGADRAVFLAPCAAIHTWFMRLTLDVVFLDRGLRVVRVFRDLRPFRAAWGGPAAWGALELEAGWLPPDALPPGAAVAFSPSPADAGRRSPWRGSS